MPENPRCCFCRLPRADNHCELCETDVCRHCLRRLPDDAFEFQESVPEDLKHQKYCPNCYDAVVMPALERYERQFRTARELHFWTKSYRGSLPLLRSSRTQVSIRGARDKDWLILALAFKAVELGFNALTQVEIKSKKVRQNNYQRTEWQGTGLPVDVDLERVSRMLE